MCYLPLIENLWCVFHYVTNHKFPCVFNYPFPSKDFGMYLFYVAVDSEYRTALAEKETAQNNFNDVDKDV